MIPKEIPSFNITCNERKAPNLSKDTSIVIKEADKGGGIVIMNKEFYKRKILEMLDDAILQANRKPKYKGNHEKG